MVVRNLGGYVEIAYDPTAYRAAELLAALVTALRGRIAVRVVATC